VSDWSGKVHVLVVPVAMLDISNTTFFVESASSIKNVDASTRDLFVSVDVELIVGTATPLFVIAPVTASVELSVVAAATVNCEFATIELVKVAMSVTARVDAKVTAPFAASVVNAPEDLVVAPTEALSIEPPEMTGDVSVLLVRVDVLEIVGTATPFAV